MQHAKIMARVPISLAPKPHEPPNYSSDLADIMNECGRNVSDTFQSKPCTFIQSGLLGEMRTEMCFVMFDAFLKKQPYVHEVVLAANRFVKPGGTLVVRVGALQTDLHMDMCVILSAMFETVGIIKPASSNVLYEDRYIVCTKRTMLKIDDSAIDASITRLLATPPQTAVVSRVEESNVVIGYQQINALVNVINIAKNRNFVVDKCFNFNAQHAQQWCEHHGVAFSHRLEKQSNMFR